jgi:putative ABC transport system substrate-binding protein
MKRRDFIGLLGSATAMVASPPVARSQQTPTVGFLGSASPGPWARFVAAFRAGIKEMGYAEGQNLAIEFRWAEGHYDRLPKLAAELVDRNVTVLIATGGYLRWCRPSPLRRPFQSFSHLAPIR